VQLGADWAGGWAVQEREQLVELSITQEQGRAWWVVAAAGEIDIASASQLDEALDNAMSAGHERIAVDLRRVSFMDSTGLRSLIAADRHLAELDGELAVAPPGAARRLLEVAGVTGVLRIVESIEDLES
jgi:anti-sigma B factor antagonist